MCPPCRECCGGGQSTVSVRHVQDGLAEAPPSTNTHTHGHAQTPAGTFAAERFSPGCLSGVELKSNRIKGGWCIPIDPELEGEVEADIRVVIADAEVRVLPKGLINS